MRRRTIQALHDAFLCRALESFAQGYRDARRESLPPEYFTCLRDEARSLKVNAIAQYPELWRRFAENAAKAGIAIHFAKDAREAVGIIKSILGDARAHKVVKSKSMLCEEIHLNDALAADGFEIIETDLGEWIVQLDKDRPSHMVMPAIHKTADAVAHTIEQEAGRELGHDIPSLVAYARQRLRREFYSADAGITGANAAIASTGALMLVTNEGNGRMATIEPPLHIAVVGLEKIVPTTADALSILRILCPCATGQKISSYVSFIAGKFDGAQHIVVVDNGRSAMADDPIFREALHCIRCGACLNNCPVYLAVGGHVFGSTYMGGMGSAVAAYHEGIDAAVGPITLCTGCAACIENCPVGIDIPRVVSETRARVIAEKGLPPQKSLVLRRILRNRKLFHTILKAASRLQGPFTREGYIRHLPLALAGYRSLGSLPALATRPLREQIRGAVDATGEKRMRVGFFTGCLIDFIYPDIGEKIIDLLAHFGCDVVIPIEQTCCGIPASQVGEMSVAAEVAKQNLAAFTHADVDAIITGCATCASAIKGYPELLAQSPYQDDAKQFASKIYCICDFLSDVLGIDIAKYSLSPTLPSAAPSRPTVTYHDSCHLKRHLGAHTQPRKLLKAAGFDIVEMYESDRCCGFAGSFALDYPELSAHILSRKLSSIDATGANCVATDCPGCLMHLRSRNTTFQALHTAELLWHIIHR